MNKLISNLENKSIKLYNCCSSHKFRRGDGGIFTIVLGAAIGTLVLIGLYLVVKDVLPIWAQSLKTMVTL